MDTNIVAARQAAVELFNRAIEAIKHEDRQAAATHYKEAFDLLPEEDAQDRAFKAFVAYQYGVCLLKLHGADREQNSFNAPPSRPGASERVRNLWSEALRLSASVDGNTLEAFEADFPLRAAIQNIICDPLMQDLIIAEEIAMASDLAKGGQKPEAVDLFRKVLRKLGEPGRERRDTLAYVHLRLAALCSDTDHKEEAADHAEWILKNAPPDNEAMRVIMEMTVERAGRTRPSRATAKAGGCLSVVAVVCLLALALIAVLSPMI